MKSGVHSTGCSGTGSDCDCRPRPRSWGKVTESWPDVAGTALAGDMLSALVKMDAETTLLKVDARPRCATGASAVPV